MITTLVRITCDHCGDYRTFDTHDRNTAEHCAAQKGWLSHMDFYGTLGHYCCEECYRLGVEKYERARNG